MSRDTQELRERVCRANLDLVRHGLVILTFGNASEIDRRRGLVAIKPSGVPYNDLTPDRVPVLDLDGRVVEGDLRPSSDAPTHLALYRAFRGIGGIVHTHSPNATTFAQARRTIPCLGTTHADIFHGDIPLTRMLTDRETTSDYEGSVGRVIIERFRDMSVDEMPGVLVAGHGPFVWGWNVAAAVVTAVALEEIAKTTLGALLLNPAAETIPASLLERHFRRKHGSSAYYGQPGK